jgi:hypothetical protein
MNGQRRRGGPTHLASTLFALLAVVVTPAQAPGPASMNAAAERYVKLVLAVGEHDPDYVDAYYGPSAWKEAAAKEKIPLSEIDRAAADLLEGALPAPAKGADETSVLRYTYLRRQLESLRARVAILGGRRLSFDEESKALYDAVAPVNPESYFQGLVRDLERRLPGDGPLIERYDRFRNAFVIPRDKLDAVFRTAIEACRSRTLQHIELPAGERFTLEYVGNKSWSGYNWYKGGFQSLIQINTDLPIYIDRAIDLACHEGYPGHHVYNALLEQHLVRARGWTEFTVYPLFSPQSLIAEGTANFGIEVAFPAQARVEFERDALFPLAGLDPARASEYYEVQKIADRLAYAGNEAARRYLNGEIDRAAAAAWITKYALMSPARAEQRVRFIDQYRSYVINYNLGKDMVRRYIESKGGTPTRPDARWREFARLISSPRLPSGLK